MSGTERARELKRIAVFCGANAGTRPEYLQSAKDVGEELVKRNIGLVYGGKFPKHKDSRLPGLHAFLGVSSHLHLHFPVAAGGSVGMMGTVAQTVSYVQNCSSYQRIHVHVEHVTACTDDV